MSVRLPINRLNDNMKRQIIKDLTVQETAMSYGKKGAYGDVKKIPFYVIDGEYIKVPYRYAEKFTGEKPNRILKIKKWPVFGVKTELRPYQKEISPTAKEMYSKTGCCFFNVFCAFGKTVVSAYFSALFSKVYGCRTLVVFPRAIIGDSWMGTFENLTSAKVHYYDGNPIPEDAQVVLCLYTRTQSMTSEELATFSHLVIDEAHMFCAPSQVFTLLGCSPQFITCLTATHEREDGLHRMIELLVGQEKITKISSKPFFVFKVETGVDVPNEEIMRTSMGRHFGSILKYLSVHEQRNEIICNIIMANPGEKFVVLTKLKEHVEILKALLIQKLKGTRRVSTLYGSQKKYKDGEILIATYSKVGVGFDEREACENWEGRRINAALLATSIKNAEQPVGRAFRADTPLIWDVVDKQDICRSHFSKRKKWYISRNGFISEQKDDFCWETDQGKVRREQKAPNKDENADTMRTLLANM